MKILKDVVDFHHCIVRRVEQMIQLKELQEQIKQAETQLKTVRRVKKDLKYLKYFWNIQAKIDKMSQQVTHL